LRFHGVWGSGRLACMNLPADLNALSPEQLRTLAEQLIAQVQERERELQDKTREVDERERELHCRQTRIDQLTHEISILKRQQFGRRSEQLGSEQMNLLDEAIDADLVAIELELQQLKPDTPTAPSRQQPKRTALPAQLPRAEIHHEPDSKMCQCGCERVRIGEDISEKLDYTPGVFTVERHIRGKWVCKNWETLIQAPVPAHVIDKGIPTTGLLASVLINKHADHLPLYRQEQIFARGSRDTAFDTGRLGRHVRRAAATAGRRAPSGNRATGCTARKRDAGADAQSRLGQDAQGLPLGAYTGAVQHTAVERSKVVTGNEVMLSTSAFCVFSGLA